jgi:hypothetical protein
MSSRRLGLGSVLQAASEAGMNGNGLERRGEESRRHTAFRPSPVHSVSVWVFSVFRGWMCTGIGGRREWELCRRATSVIFGLQSTSEFREEMAWISLAGRDRFRSRDEWHRVREERLFFFGPALVDDDVWMNECLRRCAMETKHLCLIRPVWRG